MFGDDLKELHLFASRIGLQRRWFQQGSRLKHYDLVPSKRSLAVSLGAIEVTRNQIVRFMHLGVVGDPNVNPYSSGEIRL
jgi:hypothetical protein